MTAAEKLKDRLIEVGAGPAILHKADTLIQDEATLNSIPLDNIPDLNRRKELLKDMMQRANKLYDLCISTYEAKIEQLKED